MLHKQVIRHLINDMASFESDKGVVGRWPEFDGQLIGCDKPQLRSSSMGFLAIVYGVTDPVNE